ncbi:MAG: hypothetical protein DMG27_20525 [Acidobacteria bacterium]|nr:MAG: hypothetical protein DMG27_20525 [Acidobacteriota bacterium]
MKKDTRLTFRVHSDLKRSLEHIAAREGRSVAQICEAFLRAGAETYRKKGPGVFSPFWLETSVKCPTAPRYDESIA